MHRVFVSDKLGAEGLALLREREGLEVVFETGLDESELCARLGEVDALVVRSGTRVTRKVIESAPRLRIVGRAGIGVDNIDLQAATDHGVLVVNTPDANATTTAELAIAHMLSLSRHLPQADRSMRAGAWERSKFVGAQVAGKTVGVVGFGTIGRLVAARCKALGMSVLAHDPYVSEEAIDAVGARRAELDELLAESDYVTLHCPVTDATRGIIGREALAAMMAGARLVNCARGPLVDEEALLEALASGRLAGAALDVYQVEPPKASPLLEHENIVLTPHLGASTREAQSAVSIEIARKIADYLESGRIGHALNLPPSARGMTPASEPFGELARKLGRLATGLAAFPFEELEVGFYGAAAELSGTPVGMEALVGVLEGQLESTRINLVNAEQQAQRRGLSLARTVNADARGDHDAWLTLTVRGGGRSLRVAGTLLSQRHPRLVEIDGCHVEAVLEGELLVTFHNDRPGVVGEIGSRLGSAGVNITRMHVGLPEGGEEAVALLAIERALDGDELKAIEEIEAIRRVVQVAV